jgi:hypothetical protein
MRPRISQKEAAYLVKVLSVQHEQLKQKVSDIEQLDFDYRKMIYDLSHRIQVDYTDKGYFKGHRIVGDQEALCYVKLIDQLKEEHPNLLAEKFSLWDCLNTHEKLLNKYQAIANGEPHDGRYKKLRFSKVICPATPILSVLEERNHNY